MTREEYISMMGFSDNSPLRNAKSLPIRTGDNGIIDMTNTGIPLMANNRYLPPYSGHHQFTPNSTVIEVPLVQNGYELPGGGDPEMLFKDRYNTELTEEEQEEFNKWVTKEIERQGRDIMMDIGAYDVQGFWKSGDYKKMDEDNHGSDKWKKPNHPTFSTQSQYHGTDGWYGGHWTDEGGFQPSKQTFEIYDEEYYNWMFGLEPNRPEHLDLSRYESGINIPTPLYYKKGGQLPKAQINNSEVEYPKYSSYDEIPFDETKIRRRPGQMLERGYPNMWDMVDDEYDLRPSILERVNYINTPLFRERKAAEWEAIHGEAPPWALKTGMFSGKKKANKAWEKILQEEINNTLSGGTYPYLEPGSGQIGIATGLKVSDMNASPTDSWGTVFFDPDRSDVPDLGIQNALRHEVDHRTNSSSTGLGLRGANTQGRVIRDDDGEPTFNSSGNLVRTLPFGNYESYADYMASFMNYDTKDLDKSGYFQGSHEGKSYKWNTETQYNDLGIWDYATNSFGDEEYQKLMDLSWEDYMGTVNAQKGVYDKGIGLYEIKRLQNLLNQGDDPSNIEKPDGGNYTQEEIDQILNDSDRKQNIINFMNNWTSFNDDETIDQNFIGDDIGQDMISRYGGSLPKAQINNSELGKEDISVHKNELLTKLNSETFLNRYIKNWFHVTGEDISIEDAKINIQNQIDYVESGPDEGVVFPKDIDGMTQIQSPYHPKGEIIRDNASASFETIPTIYGDEQDYRDEAIYPASYDYPWSIGFKYDDEGGIYNWKTLPSLKRHELGHTYNTYQSPLWNPTHQEPYFADRSLEPVDQNEYGQTKWPWSNFGPFQASGSLLKVYEDIFSDDFGGHGSFDNWGQHAVHPGEISSAKIETEGELLDGGMWDYNAAAFSSENLDAMLSNNFLTSHQGSESAAHLQSIGYNKLLELTNSLKEAHGDKKKKRLQEEIDYLKPEVERKMNIYFNELAQNEQIGDDISGDLRSIKFGGSLPKAKTGLKCPPFCFGKSLIPKVPKFDFKIPRVNIPYINYKPFSGIKGNQIWNPTTGSWDLSNKINALNNTKVYYNDQVKLIKSANENLNLAYEKLRNASNGESTFLTNSSYHLEDDFAEDFLNFQLGNNPGLNKKGTAQNEINTILDLKESLLPSFDPYLEGITAGGLKDIRLLGQYQDLPLLQRMFPSLYPSNRLIVSEAETPFGFFNMDETKPVIDWHKNRYSKGNVRNPDGSLTSNFLKFNKHRINTNAYDNLFTTQANLDKITSNIPFVGSTTGIVGGGGIKAAGTSSDAFNSSTWSPFINQQYYTDLQKLYTNRYGVNSITGGDGSWPNVQNFKTGLMSQLYDMKHNPLNYQKILGIDNSILSNKLSFTDRAYSKRNQIQPPFNTNINMKDFEINMPWNKNKTGGELPKAQGGWLGKLIPKKPPKPPKIPTIKDYNKNKNTFGVSGNTLSNRTYGPLYRQQSLSAFNNVENSTNLSDLTHSLLSEYTIDSPAFKHSFIENSALFDLTNFKHTDGSIIQVTDDFWANELSNAIQLNRIISKNSKPITLTRNMTDSQFSLQADSPSLIQLKNSLETGESLQLGDITSFSVGEFGLGTFGTNRFIVKDFDITIPALKNEYKLAEKWSVSDVSKEREILLDRPTFKVINIIEDSPREGIYKFYTNNAETGMGVIDLPVDPVEADKWLINLYKDNPNGTIKFFPTFGTDIEIQIIKDVKNATNFNNYKLGEIKMQVDDVKIDVNNFLNNLKFNKKRGGEITNPKFNESPFNKDKLIISNPNNLITEIAEAGGFTEGFEESGITNLNSGYNIKKRFDVDKNLPYINYSTKPNIEGRVYYDKDSSNDLYDFNIIDVSSSLMQKNKKHERTKMIIEKYENNIDLSPTERNYLNSLGLLD